MSKIDVKVIIGSNYGDEGKGMATHFFSNQAKGRCLNVLFNGGCQRGHTVELQDGTRHVFKHFGSGTFDGADTYFDSNFMINPIFFTEEYIQLHKYGYSPVCICSPDCRVTTPYDVFINQIVENHRNRDRHGSCGFGIWETQRRYEDSTYDWSFETLISKTDKEIMSYLYRIAHNYLPLRLQEYGIYEIPDEYKNLIQSNGLAEHYLDDLRAFQTIVKMDSFDNIYQHYNTIVFEGAQGLALDEDNFDEYPHVTASKTTSLIPIQLVKNIDANIEVVYITRTYFTRHGAGRFETECRKEDICKDIQDLTNVRNDFQEHIRYGKFSRKAFLDRVLVDMYNSKKIISQLKTSLFITHMNYTGDIAGDCTVEELSDEFDTVYKSASKLIEDVERKTNGN